MAHTYIKPNSSIISVLSPSDTERYSLTPDLTVVPETIPAVGIPPLCSASAFPWNPISGSVQGTLYESQSIVTCVIIIGTSAGVSHPGHAHHLISNHTCSLCLGAHPEEVATLTPTTLSQGYRKTLSVSANGGVGDSAEGRIWSRKEESQGPVALGAGRAPCK